MNWTSLDIVSMDHSNHRLVNTSVYLATYPLDIYHLPGRLNLIPNALSHLKTPEDAETWQCDEEPVLDTFWDEVPPIDTPTPILFLSEAQITDEIRQQFTDGYKADRIYNKIIQDLKPHSTKENEDILNTSKASNPFRIASGLLYNHDINGTQHLVILFTLIPEILAESHDQKHHLGHDRMIQNLEHLHFKQKKHLVSEYIAHCHIYSTNKSRNQRPIGSLQPIQTPLEPMHTITMDFIVGLPSVSFQGILWSVTTHNSYNSLLTVTDKSSKHTLLIPNHMTYSASDWGLTFGRHLLLDD